MLLRRDQPSQKSIYCNVTDVFRNFQCLRVTLTGLIRNIAARNESGLSLFPSRHCASLLPSRSIRSMRRARRRGHATCRDFSFNNRVWGTSLATGVGIWKATIPDLIAPTGEIALSITTDGRSSRRTGTMKVTKASRKSACDDFHEEYGLWVPADEADAPSPDGLVPCSFRAAPASLLAPGVQLWF